MSERITIRHLDRFATMLNRALKCPLKFRDDHTGRANVGHFYIEQQCGRYALVRLSNADAATTEIVRGQTARECYDAAHAWFSGYLYAIERGAGATEPYHLVKAPVRPTS